MVKVSDHSVLTDKSLPLTRENNQERMPTVVSPGVKERQQNIPRVGLSQLMFRRLEVSYRPTYLSGKAETIYMDAALSINPVMLYLGTTNPSY